MLAKEARRSRLRWAVLAVTAFLLVTGMLGARTVSKLNLPGNPTAEHWGLADFRDNAYYPTVALLNGDNPYDAPAYTSHYPVRQAFPPYAPSTMALHAPFALMPFETAELAYWLFTASLTFVLTGLALAACGARRDVAVIVAVSALVLLSRPGHWNLVLGQSAMALAVATYGALYYVRTRPGLSGVCLAIAATKLTFGVPLAVLMVAMGGVRAVAVGATVVAVLSLLVCVPLADAAGGVQALFGSMLETARAFAVKVDVAAIGDGFRVDMIGLVGRLSRYQPGMAAELVMSAFVLGIGVLAVVRWRRLQYDEARIVASIVCMTVLLCMYHNAYDLLLLVLPITGAVTARQARPWSDHAGLHSVFLACLTIPFANYFASDTAVAALGVEKYSGVWVAIMSVNGLALLMTLGVLCTLAWTETAPARRNK